MTVKFPTMHPVYGLPMNFNVSDLPPSGTRVPVEFLTDVSQDTLSAAKVMGARAVQLGMIFSASAVRCDLELYTAGDGGDVLVKSWEGVDYTNQDGLYAGNLEHVDLAGLPLKIKAKNISGGSVTVRAVMVV